MFFSSKLDLLKIGEKFHFDYMLEIRRSCAAHIFEIMAMHRFQRNACMPFNQWICNLRSAHRDLWPSWTVEFSVVMWLAHSRTHSTFLFNFRDNLGKWCRTFGRLDTNFSMCKPNTGEVKNNKITTTVSSSDHILKCTARDTHHIIAQIIFGALSNDLLYVATTKKIISTMRNFTLQIKIIISMDALHMCGIC